MDFLTWQKKEGKGGMSPKRIKAVTKKDKRQYAILQYRTLYINSFLRLKNISTTKKISLPMCRKTKTTAIYNGLKNSLLVNKNYMP